MIAYVQHASNDMKIINEARKTVKTGFTTLLPAMSLLTRLQFLCKTTIDPGQFHQVKLRALVFKLICALWTALTGCDAAKPSANPAVKCIETNYDSLPSF